LLVSIKTLVAELYLLSWLRRLFLLLHMLFLAYDLT
jgi:hypothetical protein